MIEETINKKIAAIEAHKHITTGKNIGLLAIAALIITIITTQINTKTGTFTAIGCIAIIGWHTIKRIKEAEYLEQKYKIIPNPIFNKTL